MLFKLVDLTRSSCEQCNYIGSNLRPCFYWQLDSLAHLVGALGSGFVGWIPARGLIVAFFATAPGIVPINV
jgi:hypothetical protein